MKKSRTENQTAVIFGAFVKLIALCVQDMDGTGTVRYTEFLAATIEAQGGK